MLWLCKKNINTLHLCKRIVNKTVLNPLLTRHFDENFLTDYSALRWRDNERDGVSNHQPHDCLLSRLFRHRSKKASKLRVTGLCVENSPVTSEFPAQRSSNAENVSIDDAIMDFLFSQYSACVIHVTTVRTRSAKTVTQSNWLHRTSQLIYTWV